MKYNGLKIYSIADRGNPILLGSKDSLSQAEDLCRRDSLAYVTSLSGSSHLVIINISNPENPQIVGEFDTTGFSPKKIEVSGNYLYAIG